MNKLKTDIHIKLTPSRTSFEWLGHGLWNSNNSHLAIFARLHLKKKFEGDIISLELNVQHLEGDACLFQEYQRHQNSDLLSFSPTNTKTPDYRDTRLLLLKSTPSLDVIIDRLRIEQDEISENWA